MQVSIDSPKCPSSLTGQNASVVWMKLGFKSPQGLYKLPSFNDRIPPLQDGEDCLIQSGSTKWYRSGWPRMAFAKCSARKGPGIEALLYRQNG